MPAQPTTSTAIDEWSLDQLVAMLRDGNAPSPKLILKQGRIEVQRVLFKDKPCIEKRYLGNLSGRQQYEIHQLQSIGGLNDVRGHVASLSSSENMSVYHGRESVARTRWYGHDTLSWQRLVDGDNSPFKRSVPTLLAWVSGVLRACERFHELGFVHCDLLPQNIVIRHRADPVRAGRYTLVLDKPFIIDLEFCLSPQKSGAWGTGQVRDGWETNDGSPLCLVPAYHSEFICAGEVVKVIEDDDAFILKRVYKKDQPDRPDRPGRVVLKNDPFKHLPRVDWGVDLFSLGVALQVMLDKADFRGPYSRSDDDAYKYLEKLPSLLRSFNQLAPGKQPRADMPHDRICKSINALITTTRWNECTVTLPEQFANEESPVNPMLDSLDDSPLPPVKPAPAKRTLVWPARAQKAARGGILIAGLAGVVGAGAYGYENLVKPFLASWQQKQQENELAEQKQKEAAAAEAKRLAHEAAAQTQAAIAAYDVQTGAIGKSIWWLNGRRLDIAPNAEQTAWVHDTVAHAQKDLWPSAQLTLGQLHCGGAAPQVVSPSAADCGKWITEALRNPLFTSSLNPSQRKAIADDAEQQFDYMVYGPERDGKLQGARAGYAGFAQAVLPGLLARQTDTPWLALRAAHVQACNMNPVQRGEAQQTLQNLIHQHPGGDEARHAAKWLAEWQGGNYARCNTETNPA